MEMSLVSEFQTKRFYKAIHIFKRLYQACCSYKIDVFQLSDSYHIVVTSYISSMLVCNTGPIKKKEKGLGSL